MRYLYLGLLLLAVGCQKSGADEEEKPKAEPDPEKGLTREEKKQRRVASQPCRDSAHALAWWTDNTSVTCEHPEHKMFVRDSAVLCTCQKAVEADAGNDN